MKKIIIVEDEDVIREFVVINLKRVGYEVCECADGNVAKEILEKNNFNFDIAILDIMLPGVDGIELCKFLRANSKSIGIIFLSAKSQEMDKISGLMYGADDYVVKPFSPSELLARVDALYRRVAVDSTRTDNNFRKSIIMGNFILNLSKRQLKKNGRSVNLTKTEFSIMEYFFSNPGKILSRKDILNYVWESENNRIEDIDRRLDEKVIDVNIRRLRVKIEDDPSHPKYIATVWGSGYKWVKDE